MNEIKASIIALIATIGVYSQNYNSINIRIEDLIGLLTIGFILGGLSTQIYFFLKNKSSN